MENDAVTSIICAGGSKVRQELAVYSSVNGLLRELAFRISDKQSWLAAMIAHVDPVKKVNERLHKTTLADVKEDFH